MRVGWYGWSVRAVRKEAERKQAARAEGRTARNRDRLDADGLRRLADEDPAVVADVLRLWLQEEGGGR